MRKWELRPPSFKTYFAGTWLAKENGMRQFVRFQFIMTALLSLILDPSFLGAVGRPSREPNSCMDGVEMPSLAPPKVPVQDGTQIIDFKKMTEWIPKDVKKEDDGLLLMNRIADNGFQKFLASDFFKQTQLGTLNETVKEQTRIELSVKPEGEKIDHKIKAQLQPFQGIATVSYRGYFGMDYSFIPMVEAQKIKFEETLFKKKVFYETTLVRSERIDKVGIRWDW
jgi:hypothetical protein